MPNTRDKVPIGSSSASMYPGYSPADHVYGQAAMQYGSAVTKAKTEGIELKPPADLEYELGQGKGIKRKTLATLTDLPTTKGLQDNSSGSTSGSGADAPSATNVKKLGSEKPDAKDEEMGDAAQPSFYIDTNPTPVNLPFSGKNDSKRATSVSESVEENQSKKSKRAHDGELPAAPPRGKIETEDISAEVDARMKEKEEKRLRKEEKKRKKEAATQNGGTSAIEDPDTSTVAADDKKRKRESAGSSAAVAAADAPVNGEEVKKPKKKKSKKEKDPETGVKASEDAASAQKSSEPASTEFTKSSGLPLDEAQKSSESNDKKKKKVKKEDVAEQTANISEDKDPEPVQLKSKKRSKDEGADAGGKKKKKKRKLEEGAADS